MIGPTKGKMLLLALTLVLGMPPATAQEPAPAARVDFTDLRDKRQAIIRGIEQTSAEIATQRDRIGRMPPVHELEGYLRNNRQRLPELEKQLAAARKQGNPSVIASLEREVSNEKGLVERTEADIAFRKDADRRIVEHQDALAKKQIELSGIESKIDDLLRRDLVTQDFKRVVSLMFAGLVLAVILGFFSVAFYDKRVRRTIFAGESGIQFITLFSLVIAIILFGITGILGDKELSALLGGLSGYILGRAMNRGGESNGGEAAASENSKGASPTLPSGGGQPQQPPPAVAVP